MDAYGPASGIGVGWLGWNRVPRRGVTLSMVLLVSSCAIGRVQKPDGTVIAGVALGAARLESCEPAGSIAPSSGAKDGTMVGPCARVTGGSMSEAFAGVLGAAVSGAVLYFTGGVGN